MYRFASLNPSPRLRVGAAARGQELGSLAQLDSLRGRFFSWRGRSGRRYVCSVFQAGEDGFVADVTNGVIIGVARDGAAARPVSLLLARSSAERRSLRELARELRITEWHVHFCAGEETLLDLAGSLLN